jgi:homoprotocatechuate degradation regulator HpaR
MNKRIVYRNLPNLLLKARECILAEFRPIISHFGLTEQQWRILRTLDEMGEIEQRELSETCQILGPSLTGVLSRMEEMDLIVRHRMAEDQRRVTVRLSRLGEKIVEAMSPLITEQYRNVEKAYGPALMAELFEAMDKFLRHEKVTVAQVKLPRPDEMDKDVLKVLK